MFTHSSTYDRYLTIYDEISQLLVEKFVEEFVDHLYGFEQRRNHDDTKLILVWIGEQGSYSAVVNNRDPKAEMYDIIREFDNLYGSEGQFGVEVEKFLNKRYAEENPGKLLVHLHEHDPNGPSFQELMTFEYDPLWGWGD